MRRLLCALGVASLVVPLAGCGGGAATGSSTENQNQSSEPSSNDPSSSDAASGDVAALAEAESADGYEIVIPEPTGDGTIPAPPDVAAPPPHAQRSDSGLAWLVLTPGQGTRHPRETSRVRVHYTGWRAEDGAMFDSSITRGRPASFGLNQVIPGWTEGVQQMVEGERTRIWIPVELAYAGRPGRPEGMLVFDVELLEIETY